MTEIASAPNLDFNPLPPRRELTLCGRAPQLEIGKRTDSRPTALSLLVPRIIGASVLYALVQFSALIVLILLGSLTDAALYPWFDRLSVALGGLAVGVAQLRLPLWSVRRSRDAGLSWLHSAPQWTLLGISACVWAGTFFIPTISVSSDAAIALILAVAIPVMIHSGWLVRQPSA